MLGTIPEIVARYKGKKAITAICRDAFFNPAFLRGTTQFLMDMIDNPDLVHELIEITLAHDIRAMQRVIQAGVDVVVFGDDYADKNSPLMSPRHFKEFILPGLTRCVKAAHEAGAYVIKHTDGNIMPILDMIVDTGIDGLNPLEPVAGMDIGLIKQRYGKRIALIGNIDCGYLLSQAPVDEVRQVTRETMRVAMPGGGYLPLQHQQHPLLGQARELHGHDRDLARVPGLPARVGTRTHSGGIHAYRGRARSRPSTGAASPSRCIPARPARRSGGRSRSGTSGSAWWSTPPATAPTTGAPAATSCWS